MAAPASDFRPNLKPMDVKQRATSSLKPYKTNPRRITEAAVDKVAASLKEFGFRQPIVVDKNDVIIAGHTRWRAAGKLGLKTVPVHMADNLSRTQVKAYRLADNRTGEESSWDDDLLTDELEGLNGFDLSLTGFDEKELAALIPPSDGHTDEDAAPEPPTSPVTKLGDVWRCGAHRVLCGDATNADDVAKLIGRDKVELCLTDPPYGVGLEYNEYEDAPAALDALIVGFLPIARDVAKRVMLTPGNGNQHRYPNPDWTVAWFYHGVGRGPWGFTCWQPVLAYGKDVYLARGEGCRPDAFINSDNLKTEGVIDHPVPKPVSTWRWVMERGSSRRGDIIYDPFLGSGTTMIVAETTGRVCLGIEIDPAYVDVIVNRWQDFTGETATRESDG